MARLLADPEVMPKWLRGLEVHEPVSVRTLRGQVVDADGRALPSVRVRYRPGGDSTGAGSVEGRSDARGAFELAGIEGGGQVQTEEPSLVTVLAGACREDDRHADTVVVAVPAGWIGVHASDTLGDPSAGARVRLELPGDLRSRLEQQLERSSDVDFEARTDASGRAEFVLAPLLAGASLSVVQDGYRPARVVLDATSLAAAREGRPLEVVLEHLAAEVEALAGSVVDEYGDPLPGASVSYRWFSTRSDVDGRFWLHLSGWDEGLGWYGEAGADHDLVALVPGYLPGSLRPELDARSGRPIWPDPIVLQPAGRPLSIAGRVVDRSGAPLAGYSVFLRRAGLVPGGRTLEATLAGATDQGFFYSVRSDAEGRFEIGGLLDRDYDLGAIDVETLLRGDLDGVAAGTRDAEIQVDTTRRWSRVGGRVVDRDGTPIEGVGVQPFVLTQTASGADGVTSSSEQRASVATAADGTFTLRDVPFDTRLWVTHPDIMHADDLHLPPADCADARERETLEGLEIVVAWRLRFQVLLDDPATADSFQVLDAQGTPLDLYTQTADAYVIRSDNHELEGGRSRHLFVEQGARTLVLLRGELEVARLPLELRPGEELQVRL